jgi:RNA polymerase sigma factor (sigma-70 family)
MSVTETRGGEPVLVTPLLAAPILTALNEDLDSGFVELFGAYRRLVFSVAVRGVRAVGRGRGSHRGGVLRAYRALRGYPPERILALQPRAWLVTILLNVWRNHVRAAARRPAVDLASVTEPIDPGADVDAVIDRRDTSLQLARQLAQLPEQQRIAVVLRHVNGLPISEIADVLGCPPGTVKSHISRGLRRLRELSAAHPDLCEVSHDQR